MDCARVAREQVLERYLLDRLSEEDRDAFEEHYFECAGCFDELQTLRAVREELARTPTEPDQRARRFFGWAAVAGFGTAAIVLISLVLSLHEPVSAPRETATAQASSRPEPEQTKLPPATHSSPEPAIEQLAKVEPPPYQPPTLRGPLDEATLRFRRGMERYRKADYTTAVDDLRGALELDPDAAHINFFLGVSQLMSAKNDAAIETLRRTIALGDSPYLEDAHFYLAKAFLRRKDLEAAKAELYQVIALQAFRSEQTVRRKTVADGKGELKEVTPVRGLQSAEARELLAEIERRGRGGPGVADRSVWPAGQLLTIKKPAGGTIVGPGIECGTRGSLCWTMISTGEAIELQTNPDKNYVWRAYTGDCAPTGRTSMNGPKTCGATFGPVVGGATAPVMFRLTITKPEGGTIVGTGGILCGTNGAICSADIPSGVPVSIKAEADEGYSWQQFAGDCSSTGEMTMTSAKSCGAVFIKSAEARSGIRAEAKSIFGKAQAAEGRGEFGVAVDLYRRAHQLDQSLPVDDAIQRIIDIAKKKCEEALVDLAFDSRNQSAISALQEAVKMLPTTEKCAARAKEILQHLKK